MVVVLVAAVRLQVAVVDAADSEAADLVAALAVAVA